MELDSDIKSVFQDKPIKNVVIHNNQQSTDTTDSRITQHLSRLAQINDLHHKFMTRNVRWKCCCFSATKGLIQFTVETFFSLIVIIFCIIQLILLMDCESQQLYSGILSFVLGILIPQPNIRYHIE